MEQYPHLDLGFETQSVHTVDELERSDVLSYIPRKDICWGCTSTCTTRRRQSRIHDWFFSPSAFPTRHRMQSFFPHPQSSVPKRDCLHSSTSPCPRKLSQLSLPFSLPVFAQSSIKARIFLA